MRTKEISVPASNGASVDPAPLARVAYDPSSLASYTISGATPATIDATNLVLPDFTVPDSGQVRVEMSFVCLDADGRLMLSVLDSGGTLLAGPSYAVSTLGSGGAVRVANRFLITGLTPGATVSGWRPGASHGGTGSGVIRMGESAVGAQRGPGIVEVFAA